MCVYIIYHAYHICIYIYIYHMCTCMCGDIMRILSAAERGLRVGTDPAWSPAVVPQIICQ